MPAVPTLGVVASCCRCSRVAEVLVIHLPAERSSHSLLLREIPAVVGLTFLPPPAVRHRLRRSAAGLALFVWSGCAG